MFIRGRKALLIAASLMIIFVISTCQGFNTAQVPSPTSPTAITSTSTPSSTPTSTPTPTITPTLTPFQPVSIGTPLPQVTETISTENASRIIELARWKGNPSGDSQNQGNIAFSPNGSILASVSDFNILLWKIPDLTLLNILPGHTRDITSLAFSPDGRTLASGSMDSITRLRPISEKGLSATFSQSADCQDVTKLPPPSPVSVNEPI